MDYTSFAPGNKSIKPDYNLPELPSPHKPFTHKFLGTVLIALALAGGVAYSIWMWGNQISQDAAVASPSPSVASDSTAAWKTYSNTQYGFSIKYPDTWKVQFDEDPPDPNLKDANGKIVNSEFFLTFLETDSTVQAMNMQMHGDGNFTSKGSIDANVNYLKQVGDITNSETELDVPGGKIFYGYSGDNFKGDAGPYFGADAVTASAVYHLNGTAQVGNQNLGNLFKQILSTFQFTTPVDTSDWKTYANTKYAYSIKYPSAWNYYDAGANSDMVLTGMSYTTKPLVGINRSNFFAGGTWDISPAKDPNQDVNNRLTFEIEMSAKADGISIDDFFNGYKKSYPTDETDFTIDGLPAMTLTSPEHISNLGSEYFSSETIIKGSDRVYHFYTFRPDLYKDVINTFRLK